MGDVNHSPIPFRVYLSKSYLTMITMETEDIQDIILKNMFLSGFDIILFPVRMSVVKVLLWSCPPLLQM